jgi:hypothetical protein
MINFEDIKIFFKKLLSDFQSSAFYIAGKNIYNIPNSRFVFVLFVSYVIFTGIQARHSMSRSMSPIQINILFGLSLLIFLQIAFRFIKGFTLYENSFSTLMISAITLLLALIFTIGKNLDEPTQITTVTTSIVFIFTYYVSRYYNFITEPEKTLAAQPINDSLLKAILFSVATGTFVLGITREYTKQDRSFLLTAKNKHARPKKDSSGKEVYVVPVYIYRWKDPKKKGLGAVRYPGEVIEYDKTGGPKGKKRRGIIVEYIDSDGKQQQTFISWMELKEKGSSILIKRGKKADGTDDTGECNKHERIPKLI